MTNITKRSLVAAGVLAALMAGNVALAADVPAGVTLAEKQTLVRNNGSEVQSLDLAHVKVEHAFTIGWQFVDIRHSLHFYLPVHH